MLQRAKDSLLEGDLTDQVRSLLLRKQRLAHVGGRECFRERRTQAWEVAHKRAEKILELLAESKSLLFRPLFPRIPKQLYCMVE